MVTVQSKTGERGSAVNFEKAYFLFPFVVTQARGGIAALPPFCCHYLPRLNRNQSLSNLNRAPSSMFSEPTFCKAGQRLTCTLSALNPAEFMFIRKGKGKRNFQLGKISEPVFVNKVLFNYQYMYFFSCPTLKEHTPAEVKQSHYLTHKITTHLSAY